MLKLLHISDSIIRQDAGLGLMHQIYLLQTSSLHTSSTFSTLFPLTLPSNDLRLVARLVLRQMLYVNTFVQHSFIGR